MKTSKPILQPLHLQQQQRRCGGLKCFYKVKETFLKRTRPLVVLAVFFAALAL
jgi:hypothetical protein